MIDFACPNCGKRFSVPDEFEGRRASCKGCQGPLTVPPKTAPAAAAPRIPMRQRRLQADAQQMKAAFEKFEPIQVIEALGEPPEVYRVEYSVTSLHRQPGAEPTKVEKHRVEIQLPLEYPRLAPLCRMLTPIFHPNIDDSAVCVGDHWTAGERLVDLVIRIGEMLAFQAYNIQSPLNAEAAMWTDLHAEQLPLDNRDLRPPTLS